MIWEGTWPEGRRQVDKLDHDLGHQRFKALEKAYKSFERARDKHGRKDSKTVKAQQKLADAFSLFKLVPASCGYLAQTT